MSENDNWKTFHTIGTIIGLVLLVVVGLSIPNRLLAWLLIVLLLVASVGMIGHGRTGLWRGIFIDERYKLSLSRIQLILWTILILSAFFTATLRNIALTSLLIPQEETARPGLMDALSIGVPEEIWLLMGISTTTLVASPLIRSNKTKKEPDSQERLETLEEIASQRGMQTSGPEALGQPIESVVGVTNKGLVLVNNHPSQSRLSDLFSGEETGNGALVDMGKTQNFYFTIILVLAYAVLLGNVFIAGGVVNALPAIPSSMLALLGISHAGYLTSKAVVVSQTQ